MVRGLGVGARITQNVDRVIYYKIYNSEPEISRRSAIRRSFADFGPVAPTQIGPPARLIRIFPPEPARPNRLPSREHRQPDSAPSSRRAGIPTGGHDVSPSLDPPWARFTSPKYNGASRDGA